MRITIVSIDSRGDVQPCVALGLGLCEAGHSVRLVTHPEHAELIPQRRLEFFALEGNPRSLLAARELHGRQVDRNPLLFTRRVVGMYGTMMRHYTAECLKACQGSDAIMFSVSGFVAASVAEKLRVPFFPIYLQPVSPTRAFPNALFGAGLRLGGAYNRLTYGIGRQVFWQLCRQPLNRARQEILDLPPLPFTGPYRSMDRRRQPILYAYSPAVVPKPPDWGDWLHVTGYWFLDHAPAWHPPADLVDFLESGTPPVYVGFGSTNRNNRGTKETTELIVEALARAGCRGILSTGGSGVSTGPQSDDIFTIESVPHDWLFPRTQAVVHHGGAGTTAAALKAGIPSVIVPYFVDQPFWGWRVYDLGVGPKPIPRSRLTVERLAQAISTAVRHKEMRMRATSLGERIRAEDGVTRAVEAFHHHIRAIA